MTFVKIVKFRDKGGKRHAYAATIVDGVMLASDWQNIQKIQQENSREKVCNITMKLRGIE